jgi:hypothetical protein
LVSFEFFVLLFIFCLIRLRSLNLELVFIFELFTVFSGL